MVENSIKLLEYIDAIIKETQNKKNNVLQFFKDEPLVCFRGEPETYISALMPSLFRKNMDMLSEKKYLELISDYGITGSSTDSNIEKAIDAQHFISVSRLLDITFSLLPALFFASEDNGKTGKLFYFIFPESFSPNSKYLKQYYDDIVSGDIVPYPKDFKVITNSYLNERVKMQSGGFILFPGESYQGIPEHYYSSIDISKDDKKIIREELETYFNITEASLFPEKDKRKEVIESKIKSLKSVDASQLDELNELKSYVRRLEFEINSKRIQDGMTSKKIQRYIRKEFKDLEGHVDQFSDKEKVDVLKAYLNQESKYIKLQNSLGGEVDDSGDSKNS